MKHPSLKVFHFICIFIVSLWTWEGTAQNSAQTPREIIINDIIQFDALPRVGDSKMGANTPIPLERAPPQISTENTVISPSPKTPKPTTPEVSIAEFSPMPGMAPFYLSAQEYKTVRGESEAPQLVLKYHVSTKKKGELLPTTATIELLLGVDYAGIHTKNAEEQITKIYDFALNRRLRMRTIPSGEEGDKKQFHFENTSLYASVYRNISTVKNVTQNGQLRNLPIAKGKTLDAFWVESAMSWTAQETQPKLKVSTQKSALNIFKNNAVIFEAIFSKSKFTHAAFKQNLLGFAHHEWPLHPRILAALAKYNSPPKHLKMLSYGPGAPNGETQIWTLVDTGISNAKFPLPGTSVSVVENEPVDPFALVINQAVRGQAGGGAPNISALKSAFLKTQDADVKGEQEITRVLELWLMGQQYEAYTGMCIEDNSKNGDNIICQSLKDIELQSLAKPESLQDFIKAKSLAKSRKTKADALKILAPYLGDPQTPAFIIRTIALASAQMPKADLKALETELGIERLYPINLLQSALAKDPYDPHTYLALAQIYAANGALETSWDIYDALRAGITTVGALDLKIGKVEDKLRSQAPGFFNTNVSN